MGKLFSTVENAGMYTNKSYILMSSTKRDAEKGKLQILLCVSGGYKLSSELTDLDKENI